MPSQRVARVQNLLRAEISTVLLRKLKDPRVRMVTLTEVDVAPDLKSAQVYVSVYGERAAQEETLQGLRSAAGFIRRELMEVLDLRPMPFLTFTLDESLERGTRTLDLLDRVLHEQHEDESHAGSGDSPDPTQP
jgi:ribosome-binding factor A